ncbi:11542_t:CDS:2, partial [Dentiscutata erythropus]
SANGTDIETHIGEFGILTAIAIIELLAFSSLLNVAADVGTSATTLNYLQSS